VSKGGASKTGRARAGTTMDEFSSDRSRGDECGLKRGARAADTRARLGLEPRHFVPRPDRGIRQSADASVKRVASRWTWTSPLSTPQAPGFYN